MFNKFKVFIQRRVVTELMTKSLLDLIHILCKGLLNKGSKLPFIIYNLLTPTRQAAAAAKVEAVVFACTSTRCPFSSSGIKPDQMEKAATTANIRVATSVEVVIM